MQAEGELKDGEATGLTAAQVQSVSVMTRSASGSDSSLSCAQPSLTPGCFSPDTSRDAMRHVTWSQGTRLLACMRSPANAWPQRVCACLLLMSLARDSVYKSSLVPRDKLA